MIRIIFENKKLLNEIKMEQVMPRFESKAFIAAAQKHKQIRAKKYGYLDYEVKLLTPDYIKEMILRRLPEDIKDKYKPEALNWLISTFIKEAEYFNLVNIDSVLETFYHIKEVKMDRILSKKDIYTIESFQELRDIVSDAKPEWEAYKKERMDKDADLGTNKIYEDDDWEVFIPENKGASCKLGKGTNWCTAAPGLEYYKRYHKKDDPLFIFISKRDPSEKYQFHYGKEQFRDKNDKDIPHTLPWFELNNIVANIENQRIPDEIKRKASRYSKEFDKKKQDQQITQESKKKSLRIIFN